MALYCGQKSLTVVFCLFFFSAPDLECSVLHGCCSSVWSCKPPTLLTPELSKCTSHLPPPSNIFQLSLLQQDLLHLSCPGIPALFPTAPGSYLPFFPPLFPVLVRPLLTFCPQNLCHWISETEMPTVPPEIPVWSLQTIGLC